MTAAHLTYAEAARNLLVLFGAILANAFFAASEIAIISLNDAKVRRDADEGDRMAGLLRKFIDAPGRFLATLQVGVTLTGFLASAFTAVAFAAPVAGALERRYGLDGAATEGVVTALMTVFLAFATIVFGELVPKRIAMKHSDGIARFAARPLRLVERVTHPFVSLLNATADCTLKILGVSVEGGREKASEEEIRMMADIAEESGAIQPQEKEMIENVFELNNTTAEEVMVHRKDIIAVPVDAPPDEARARVLGAGVSRIPVYLETIDDIIGIMSARDFLVAALDGKTPDIASIMRKPFFVPETIHADKLLHTMQKQKRYIAVVLDEHGGTSGIVTVEDLLEEIVGEIYDERDTDEVLEIRQVAEDEFRMPGEMGIGEVSEEIGVNLDESDFNTIGGYVFGKLNAVPVEGTVFDAPELGLTFKVEKMDGRRIGSVVIRKIAPPQTVADGADDE